jgi:heat shock protein HslJ
MNARFLRFPAVALVAALALTGCDDGEPRSESTGLTHTPADVAELNGSWAANYIRDPDTSIVPGSRIQIIFHDDSLSANAGCNTLIGAASIDGDQLAVDTLASTQKACEDDLTRQDAWLSDFLTSGPTVEVLGPDLWLSHGDDTVLHLTQQ